MTPKRVWLGGNEFVDCEAPIALGSRPLLAFRIDGGRLEVALDVPSPPAKTAMVARNTGAEGAEVTVSFRDQTVLRAGLRGGDVDVEELDLRPLGLAVVADKTQLRLGRSVVSQNVFVGARFGIQLSAEPVAPGAAAG